MEPIVLCFRKEITEVELLKYLEIWEALAMMPDPGGFNHIPQHNIIKIHMHCQAWNREYITYIANLIQKLAYEFHDFTWVSKKSVRILEDTLTIKKWTPSEDTRPHLHSERDWDKEFRD